MSYVIRNSIWPPPIGTLIVTHTNKQNVIGIIDKYVDDNNIVLVKLNTHGKMLLNKNASWFIISAKSTPTIRYSFDMYDGNNIPQYITDHYKTFANKYNLQINTFEKSKEHFIPQYMTDHHNEYLRTHPNE